MKKKPIRPKRSTKTRPTKNKSTQARSVKSRPAAKIIKRGGPRPKHAPLSREESATSLGASPTKMKAVLQGFDLFWANLFTTPVHLDSGLSKLSPRLKSILAQIVPMILLRPNSLAEALGVGMAPGEPWSLEPDPLAHWRPAQLMTERIYEMMARPPRGGRALEEDFPPVMISEWKSSWGEAVTKELVEVLSQEPPLSLRASRRVGAQAVLQELKESGQLPVRIELSNLTPLGVRLSGYAPVLGTPLFEKGGFEIQDEGSQLMSLFALWPERYGAILQDRPGLLKQLEMPAPPPPKDTPAWTVVDACAGAGGKSLALADALKGKGRVYAYDTSETKLQALRRRATHAGLNNIQAVAVKEGHEGELIGKFDRSADLVLVDAPCSGWGVLRRNPDIKWRQKKDTLTRMPEIQYRLLSEYSRLVKPGGRLVYGVCTFRLAETRDIIARFLKDHPEFSPQEGGFLGPGPCDGFFMQGMTRKAG